MPSPKARWFVDELDEDLDADPFEAPIQELGVEIDLRAAPDLLKQLTALVRAEGELDAAGVRCAIRDRPSSVCSACPLSQAAIPGDGLPALCRNGISQDRVLTLIAVQDRDASSS